MKVKEEWMVDAFGAKLEVGDFVVFSTSISSIDKREVVGATAKSIRVGFTYNYKGEESRYTHCYNRSRVALYEKGNKNV